MARDRQQFGSKEVTVGHHHAEVGVQRRDVREEFRAARSVGLQHWDAGIDGAGLDWGWQQRGMRACAGTIWLRHHCRDIGAAREQRIERRYGEVGGPEEDHPHQPAASDSSGDGR
jgi:hypothetical protein